MTVPLSSQLAPNPLILEKKDRRRHKRVALKLGGRFLNSDGDDHGLITVDISCSGAMLYSTNKPALNAAIVCYLDEIGRVAATVTRRSESGFAVSFKIPDNKRDKLADRLTWLINKDKLGLVDDRAAPRIAAGEYATLLLADGRSLNCRMLDISLTGASFEADGAPPMVGEAVQAGNLKGVVVRVADRNFAIRYVR